jgi:hypothetical protein
VILRGQLIPGSVRRVLSSGEHGPVRPQWQESILVILPHKV